MVEKKHHQFKVFVNPEIFNMQEIQKIHKSIPSSIDPKSAICISCGNDQGYAFVFYFGAVAFWNVPEHLQKDELESIFPVMKGHSNTLVTENFQVIESIAQDSKVSFNYLSLDKLTQERAEVVASVMAQSGTMEYYENITREIWNNLDDLLGRLKKKGTISPFPGKLHKRIAHSIITRSKVVRVLHLLDRPDLIWSDPVMDNLYSDLRASFDLPERFQALEYKLTLIQDTLSLLLDTSRDRRAYWLEMTIVILILFEVVITIIEKWF